MNPSAVEIVEVRNRRDRDRFIAFQWNVYRNDPLWVPPLWMDRRTFFNPAKHPFYKHGTAALFLAMRNGQVVGRIMASQDPNYNEFHGTDVGCFGAFETIDDPAVSAALLDAAADWVRQQRRTALMGPLDYSTNYPCGLLVEGFDTPPRMLMNHNPAYYQPLVESWGLTKAMDLYCWWYPRTLPLEQKWARVAKRLAERAKFVIRPANKRRFYQEAELIKSLYPRLFEKNWGFVPLSDAEFDHMVSELKMLIIPDLCLFAEVDGEPVGFSLTVSDVNEALKHINGRLTTFGIPIGLCKLLYHYKRAKTARLMVIGVLPEYRRRGILEMLILRTSEYGKQVMGYDAAELGWTLEENELINRAIAATGASRYKTYRIYDKQLT